MAVQLQKSAAPAVPATVERPGSRVLQAAVPLLVLLVTSAAGLGVISLVGTGGRDVPGPVPSVAPTAATPSQLVGPNVWQDRVSWASSCPPLLDGHPSHRVVRTWVCPKP